MHRLKASSHGGCDLCHTGKSLEYGDLTDFDVEANFGLSVSEGWLRPPVLLRHAETGPRIRFHIPLQRLLPVELGMRLQVFGGFEVHAAGVPGGRRERHLRGHGRVGDFILHRAGRADKAAARAAIRAARDRCGRKGALARLFFLGERVVVVGQEALRRSARRSCPCSRPSTVPSARAARWRSGSCPSRSKSVSSRISFSLMGKFEPTK